MVSMASSEYRIGVLLFRTPKCIILYNIHTPQITMDRLDGRRPGVLVHAQIRNLERVEPDGRRTRRVLLSDNLHNETNIIIVDYS